VSGPTPATIRGRFVTGQDPVTPNWSPEPNVTLFSKAGILSAPMLDLGFAAFVKNVGESEESKISLNGLRDSTNQAVLSKIRLLSDRKPATDIWK